MFRRPALPRFIASVFVIVLLAALLLSVTGAWARPLLATSPTLGTAASYSVLAGSTVTNTGPTTMPGNLGVSPGSAVTGFPPGVVGPPGTIHAADASAAAAQADNLIAFGALDQPCDTTYTGVQDLTLVSPLGPGVYCADAFLLTGNLTLSGSGVWIFKSAATLTTATNSSVTGGDPCNVWWRLASSGTLFPGTSFIGNILALASISLQTGASLDGRALAQTGAVTLDTNTITGPTCAQASTATSTTSNTATVTKTPTMKTQPTRTPTTTPGGPTMTMRPTRTPTNTPGGPTATMRATRTPYPTRPPRPTHTPTP